MLPEEQFFELVAIADQLIEATEGGNAQYLEQIYQCIPSLNAPQPLAKIMEDLVRHAMGQDVLSLGLAVNCEEASDFISSLKEMCTTLLAQWRRRSRRRQCADFTLPNREEIRRLILRKFPPSLAELTEDVDFAAIMDGVNCKSDELKNFLANIWDQEHIKWNKKSFRSIIIARSANPESFANYRNYYGRVYRLYSLDFSLKLIQRLLLCQFGSAEQVIEFIKVCEVVINKSRPKKNTLFILGPTRCGKELFINTIKDLVWSVGECELNLSPRNLIHKQIGFINELTISEDNIGFCKWLFEGHPMDLDEYQTLPRTPIIVTSSNDWYMPLSPIDREAFEQRIYRYQWQTQPWLQGLRGYPHPLIWSKLLLLGPSDFDSVPDISWLTEANADYFSVGQVFNSTQ